MAIQSTNNSLYLSIGVYKREIDIKNKNKIWHHKSNLEVN